MSDGIHADIIPLEKYITAKIKIKHQCKRCGYQWTVSPTHILNCKGHGCPVCRGTICISGINDMCTTNPALAAQLKNPDEGLRYSKGSNVKVNWICQNCKNIIKQKPISKVATYGLACPLCSDGISIPNKFIANILLKSGVDFNTEKSFVWSENKRYDIYIESLNAIVEMHGAQHYLDSCSFCSGITTTYEEQHSNDVLKQNLALCNGISHYIVIDCKESTLEWMMPKILESEISQLISIDDLDFMKCFELSMCSNVSLAAHYYNTGFYASEISKFLHVSHKTINNYLNTATEIGLCEYVGVDTCKRKVQCLTTGQIFNSITQAARFYGLKSSKNIIGCCKNKDRHAGTDKATGLKLKWQYC